MKNKLDTGRRDRWYGISALMSRLLTGLSYKAWHGCTPRPLVRWRKDCQIKERSIADKHVQHNKRKAKEGERPHVTLENKQLENVYSFTYLGSNFQADGDDMADVKHRINVAQAAFSGLYHCWRDHRLPISMKVRLCMWSMGPDRLYSSHHQWF